MAENKILVERETFEKGDKTYYSYFINYFDRNKFDNLFIYKFDENNELRLAGCQFWNIPYADLEGNVKKVWKETKKIIKG